VNTIGTGERPNRAMRDEFVAGVKGKSNGRRSRLGRREDRVAGVLWGIVLLLVILWVVVKLVLGIAGALFHLLLVVAVVVGVYALIKVGASRRV
jgi:hypothetical protein